MPFIWDDNQYLLVDDEEKYDTNRYVIARKLFVTLTKEDVGLTVSVRSQSTSINSQTSVYEKRELNIV